MNLIYFKQSFLWLFMDFFRVGELTVDVHKRTNHFVRLQDIQVYDDRLEVCIPSSKTDQYSSGTTLIIQAQKDNRTCPVRLLKQFLKERSPNMGALFCHFDKSPLSRYQFSAVLKKAISSFGVPTKVYKSHSFRLGAATTFANEGRSDEEIKSFGRWKSEVFRNYIRISC